MMGNSYENEKEDKSIQSYAALGVGLVAIVIGVPLWWKTTEVYRVQLPYSDIDELASVSLRYLTTFQVVSFNTHHDDKYLHDLRERLHSHLNKQAGDDSKLIAKFSATARLATTEEHRILDRTGTVEDLDASLDRLVARQHGNYTAYLLPRETRLSSSFLSSNVIIGSRRAIYITPTDDKDVLVSRMVHVMTNVLTDHTALKKAVSTGSEAIHREADKESMRSLRRCFGYDVTFTLFNPQPDMLRAKWNIVGAIEKYLGSIVATFSDFAQLNVKSQFLHYVGLGVLPKRDPVAQCSVLPFDQLPHIINPIEAYLGSHVSNNPNINFIVYIPTRDQSPLKIYDESGKPSTTNALFSPRWGGLFVYNVDTPSSLDNITLPITTEVNMKDVMSVFAVQLRLLLGINSAVSSGDVTMQSSGRKVVSDWELDSWLRERCIENLATSSSTLRSLTELLDRIQNLVINDDIGNQVKNALRHLRESREHLEKAQLKSAFISSREALKASEKAFFDPSLLELLYFPEDQKFAIYIPLFLPIGIPIVLSVVQALKWLVKKDGTKTKVD